MEPARDRDWSRAMRYTCSIIFIVVGAYFMVFALDQSGYVGVHGSGATTNCQYESDSGTGNSGGSHTYRCDVDVHWSDGTTTPKTSTAPRRSTAARTSSTRSRRRQLC
jgi:hypothetical protein